MNVYIISGIILIAIGTFLAVFGSIILSKKSSDENLLIQQQQYENLILSVDSLKQKRVESITKKQITKIENELQEWINSGSLAEDNKRHELQNRIVEMEQRQIDKSKEWLHVYEYFYRALETTLQGYNSEGITDATYEFPELPSNLFSIHGSNYNVKVTFSTGKEWIIRHHVSEDQDINILPKIIFQFGAQEESPLRFKLWITMIPYSDQNRMKIKKAGPMITVLEDIPSQFSLRTYRYEPIFRDLVRTLIEYELVRAQ